LNRFIKLIKSELLDLYVYNALNIGFALIFIKLFIEKFSMDDYGNYVYLSSIAIFISILLEFGGEQSSIGIIKTSKNIKTQLSSIFSLKLVLSVVISVLIICLFFNSALEMFSYLVVINLFSSLIPIWFAQVLDKTRPYVLTHFFYILAKIVVLLFYNNISYVLLFQIYAFLSIIYACLLFTLYSDGISITRPMKKHSIKLLSFSGISISNYIFSISTIIGVKLIFGNSVLGLYNLYDKGIKMISIVLTPVISTKSALFIKTGKLYLPNIKIILIFILGLFMISIVYEYLYINMFMNIKTHNFGQLIIFITVILSILNQYYLRFNLLKDNKISFVTLVFIFSAFINLFTLYLINSLNISTVYFLPFPELLIFISLGTYKVFLKNRC